MQKIKLRSQIKNLLFLPAQNFGELSEWVVPKECLRQRSTRVLIMFCAYVLKSLSKGTHYYGSTENLAKRLKEHNVGKVRSSKGRRPWVVHYFEEFETRSEALTREKFFKSIDGYLYLKEKGII